MQQRREPMIKRFCDYMGRQHAIARLAERIARWLLPPTAGPALAGAGWPMQPGTRREDSMRPKPMAMATGPYTQINYKGKAPDNPIAPEEMDDTKYTGGWWDRPGAWDNYWHHAGHAQRKADYDRAHTFHACQDDKFHGMHGKPCKYAGGTDIKCPKGTTSGWFWSYDCPNIGRVFYVDCCGSLTVSDRTWCGWTKEDDWCQYFGKAANAGITGYVCTVAIPDAAMKTVEVSPGKLEVVGVDP
jgi:hypothetical protein